MERYRLHKRKGIVRHVRIPFLCDIEMEAWESGKPVFNGYSLIAWETIRVKESNTSNTMYNRERSRLFLKGNCRENQNCRNEWKATVQNISEM